MLFFANASSESAPLAAEKIFNLGPVGITNSMICGLLVAGLVTSLFIVAAKRSQLKPNGRLAYYIETLVDFILSVAISSFGSRKKALKHLPLLVTLFTFIFAWNLSGLLPGVGTITSDGVPLLRAFTTDLNATLAMAILTIGTVQFYAIRELGIMGHLKHYFTNEPWKPVNMFIGVNEVFGELLRIVTLSMRLFGVIYAGEVLIHAIGSLAGNLAWAATLPVMLLEIFFAAIQAYVFMMLTTTYLSIATGDGHDEHESPEPERAKGRVAVAS